MAGVRYLITLLLLLTSAASTAQQQYTTISGRVKGINGDPLYLVNVVITGTSAGTFTDTTGYYSLRLPQSESDYTITFSSVGYNSVLRQFSALSDTISLNVTLTEDITSLREVLVREAGITEAPSLIRIPVRDIKLVPTAGSSVESLVISMPGVISTNELSSRYSVRGGSYDENLVYINGIEIYRPQLIKSGRKEGLSIINPDLTGSLFFSPGGFNSAYGDKLSSVLDIRYREPDEFRASVNASLLANSLHLEGTTGDGGISSLFGARYMTNRWLLRTLDTEANYTPYFYDIQSITSFRTGKNSRLELFLTYGVNRYDFVPLSQRSSFGNFAEAYQIYIKYDGTESDSYSQFNGALTWKLKAGESLNTSLILHSAVISESEAYDIRGRYSLNLLDRNLGSENFGDSLMNVGTGVWLDHARNYFASRITTFASDSKWNHGKNIISFGARFINSQVSDNLNEWRMVDSAGYSVPHGNQTLELYRSVKASNKLHYNRAEVYFLDNYSFESGGSTIILTGGARISYWSFNNEILFSPRVSAELRPGGSLAVYAAAGRYYQSPFYREMRRPGGDINRDIVSQKSEHYLIGARWDFSTAYTSFRLTGEIYHKVLEDLIPYKFDNVRVIYAAENTAEGTASGIDLRLNGDFARGAESWLSVSLMKASIDISGDDAGYFPAPGDVRFATDVFFQDYFPSNPLYRAHIKLHYSTGMPVSSPYEERYDNIHRMPPYRRVDIGFTRVIRDSDNRDRGGRPGGYFRELIIGFEIFNLLDINNTISYNWLTTINNLSGESRQFAVPNYLTGRSLNLKISCSF